MKFFKMLFMVFVLSLCITQMVNAEIIKSFDQFEGKFTVNSEKSIVLNECTTIKIVVTKSFFGVDGYKDTRVPVMIIQVSEPLLKRTMKHSLYWMVEGEQCGHEEKFSLRSFSETNSFIIPKELRQKIADGKPIYIKIPMIAGNPLVFFVKPESLKEWQTVIEYNVLSELKILKEQQPELFIQ